MSALQAVIIGGGPAGAACALWLHKLGVTVRLLEAGPTLGGLQRSSPYENLWLPGVQGLTGQQVARNLHEHLICEGVPVSLQTPVRSLTSLSGEFSVEAGGETLSARFVVLATGTRPRSGGLVASPTLAVGPGEPVEALDVKGRRVAVLGGGDNAFDQARFIRDRGAASVAIFSRGPVRAQNGLRALIPEVDVCEGPFTVDQAAMHINDKPFDAIAVMYGFEPVLPPDLRLMPESERTDDVLGNHYAQAAIEAAAKMAEPSPGKGQKTNPDHYVSARNHNDLALEDGYVRVDRHGETSVRGLYACGELTNFWHPCVTTSMAHGIQVARTIATRLSDQ